MNAESSARAEELSQREAAFSQSEAELQAARNDVEGLRAELDAERTAMQQRQKQLDEAQWQLERRLEKLDEQWAALAPQSTKSRREGRKRQQTEADEQAAEEDASREAACREPNGSALLDESTESLAPDAMERADTERGSAQDESFSAAIEETHGESADTPDQEMSRQSIARADDEEESVEEYMAALLSRMRGGGPPPVAGFPEPRRNKRKTDRPKPETQGQLGSREHVPVVDTPMSPDELQRRAQPQVTTNLAAMRELANIQARQAIDTHGKRRSLNRAFVTLGTSAACLVVGFIVLGFSDDAILRGTAGLILIVGIYCIVSGLLATKDVVATVRRKTTGLRAILEEVEAELAANEREAAQSDDGNNDDDDNDHNDDDNNVGAMAAGESQTT